MITLNVKKQIEDVYVPLDVLEPETVALTFDIGSPSEPMIRKSPISQTFRLPLTDRNNAFFNHFYDPDSVATTYSANFKCKARLLSDGQEIFSGGLQLIRVHLQKEEYEVLLFGEEATLFEAVKGRKLTDAFLLADGTYDTSLDHDLTQNNVINSWTYDITNGGVGIGVIRYPIVDHGYTGPNGYLHYTTDEVSDTGMAAPNYLLAEYLKPAISLDYLFRRVITEAGFNLLPSTFLESTAWTDIMMYIGGGAKPLITGTLEATRVGFESDSGQGGATTQPDTINDGYGLLPIPWRKESGTVSDIEMFDLGEDFDTTTHRYTAQFSGAYRGKLQLVFRGTGGSSNYIPMTVRVQTSALNYQQFDTQVFVGSGTNFSLKQFDWVLEGVSVGQEIETTCFSTSQDWELYRSYTGGVSYFEVNGVATAEGTVNVPANLPGMTQLDFLRDIIQRFNLVIESDKERPGFLTIDNWNDYLASSTGYDWTDKLDMSRPRQLKPTNEFKASRIELQDATDDTLALKAFADANKDRTYGFYAQNIQGDFTSGELTNDAVFAPWVPFPIPQLNDAQTFEIDGLVVPREFGVQDEDGQTDSVTGLPKLFYYNGLKANPDDLTYFIGTAELSGFPYCTAFHQPSLSTVDENTEYLGWTFSAAPYYYGAQGYGGQITLQGYWVRYWSRYLNSFYDADARVLECHLLLTAQDITNFRFNDTIKILGQNYRILSIEGYKPGTDDPTKVQLLKLVSQTASIVIPPEPPEPEDDGGEVSGPCDNVEPTTFTQFGGVIFTNSISGSNIAVTEECCIEFGYTFIAGNCVYDLNAWEDFYGSNDDEDEGPGGDGSINTGKYPKGAGSGKRGLTITQGRGNTNDKMAVSGSVTRLFDLVDSPLQGSSRNFTLMQSVAAGDTNDMSSDGFNPQSFRLPAECSVFLDIKLNVHVETKNTSATVNVGDTQFIHEQHLFKEILGTITDVGSNQITNIADTNVDCDLIVGVVTNKSGSTSLNDPGLKIAVRNNMDIVQVAAVAEVTLVVANNNYQSSIEGLITGKGELILTEEGNVITE